MSASSFDFRLKRLLPDAWHMCRQPADYFVRLKPRGSWWPPTRTILCWGLAAGALDGVLTASRPEEGAGPQEALLLALAAPVFFLLVYAILAGGYHLLCRLASGKAPFQASYRVLASLSALLPLDVLTAQAAGWAVAARVPLVVFKYHLAVTAAQGVHAAPKRRAWTVFGILLALQLAAAVLQLLSL